MVAVSLEQAIKLDSYSEPFVSQIRETPEEYRKLSQISVYRSRLVVRKRFTRDYWHWIDREARGFKKLPPDSREWFAERIFKEQTAEEASE
ncbi:MAG: hypothetical protein ACYS8W_17680 [Planctomycetota bacterium]|jgi:hypothetical protein